jgi:tRNA-2-methylthio-N6-dimethylallyladenosine synthase
MAGSPAVCPALHLPVQSGSDAVLRRMKRQYTRAEYLDLVGELRRFLPGLALSTDLIVGFPGETDAQFEETLTLLREVRFAQAFAFAYSPRPGTAAARWPNDVTPAIASARLARLLSEQQEIQHELNRSLEGAVLEILVDGLDRQGRRASGRTPCNRVTNIEGPAVLAPGTFASVRIERGYPNSLLAKLLRVGECLSGESRDGPRDSFFSHAAAANAAADS